MTKFRRYASGDKPVFTASQLNAINDAALAHSQGKSQTLQADRLRQRTGNHFPVANGTEDDLPAFSVLELQRALIEPDTDENLYKSAVAFNGIKTENDNTLLFGITQQYLSGGSIDPATMLTGVTFARLTGSTGGTWAKAKTDQYTLEVDSGGPCRILYDPGEDSSERIAIVRIGDGGGGGDCTCPEIHEFSTNGATSGTFSTTYTLDADSDVITWDWDASASEVQTAYESGSLFSSGDVTVSGGDWPNVAIYVKFNTYPWSRTYVPTVDNSSLVGGKGFMRKFSEQG